MPVGAKGKPVGAGDSCRRKVRSQERPSLTLRADLAITPVVSGFNHEGTKEHEGRPLGFNPLCNFVSFVVHEIGITTVRWSKEPRNGPGVTIKIGREAKSEASGCVCDQLTSRTKDRKAA